MAKETSNAPAAADLAAENAALKARIADYESAKAQNAADEKLISEKMAKGLRREQAAAVIKRQQKFDIEHPTKSKNK
jgi:predicted DNA-binding WGR domain protein